MAGHEQESTQETTNPKHLKVEHIVIPPSKTLLTQSPRPSIVLENMTVAEKAQTTRGKKTETVEHELGDDF